MNKYNVVEVDIRGLPMNNPTMIDRIQLIDELVEYKNRSRKNMLSLKQAYTRLYHTNECDLNKKNDMLDILYYVLFMVN